MAARKIVFEKEKKDYGRAARLRMWRMVTGESHCSHPPIMDSMSDLTKPQWKLGRNVGRGIGRFVEVADLERFSAPIGGLIHCLL
jgi:hypothetical protein